MSDQTPQISPAIPAAEGSCPPPLMWSEVLAAYRTGSTAWEAASGGLKIRGRQWGHGRPLYFLSGLSSTSELFCLSVWLLRDEFRCVLLDWPEQATTIDELVSAVLASADQHGDDRFDLFATSFGTVVALKLLERSPHRVTHSVLQGCITEMKLSLTERLAANALRFVPGSMDRLPLRRRIVASNHRLWFPPFDQSRWEFLATNTGEPSIAAVARRARMLKGLRPQPESAMPTETGPVQIVTCEGEAARHHRAAHQLLSLLPQARVEELSNCGHFPFLTHPHRLVKLMKPFLLDQLEQS